MCGGLLGEAVGGIDKVISSPLFDPLLKPTQNLTADIFGKNALPTKWFDKITNHPAESAALAAATYFTAGAGSAAFGGGAAAGAGAAGAGSLDLGMAGAGAYDAELGGASILGDAGAAGASAGAVGTTSGFGGVGTDAAVAASPDGGLAAGQAAATGDSGGSFLSSLFGGSGGGSGIGMNLSTAKNGLGLAQVLGSLYGMDQSRKLSKAASAQSVSNAGLQAVQRSMAAQGYQGSGNMMTALSKYGADAYGANLAQQQSSLTNTMSGLGLLTAGVGNLAGWGTTPATGGKP